MSKRIISKGAGLGADRDGRPTSVSCHVSHPTSCFAHALSQQKSGIRRVSRRRGGALHVAKGADEGGVVRHIVDGGLLDTELAHRHVNFTVVVALVSLGYHLVNVTGDVCGD